MSTPKVSVIIPTYKGAKFLGETIQSILNQTYSNFEIVIVNDASPDNTTEIVGQFNDPRIIYLIHETNQGADAARLLAINSSSGDILAFLDQDDLFHPDKLKEHVDYLEKHPEIGFTYNSHYELMYPANTIREIIRPPQQIGLADLVLYFPFSPSDWVLRRQWADHFSFSKESNYIIGGEYIITGRLFLDGCRFGCIDRALNYRRRHPLRILSNISAKCESEISAQQVIFNDPRCPKEVQALQDTAFFNTYLSFSYYAFIQKETALASEYVLKCISIKPSIIEGNPCELINFYVICSLNDESQNHAELLKTIVAQFPAELSQLADQYSNAVAQGYFTKSVRATVWGNPEEVCTNYEQAIKLHTPVNESFINQLTRILLNYAIEFGDDKTWKKIRSSIMPLEKHAGYPIMNQIMGCFAINLAFKNYGSGNFRKAFQQALRGVSSDPKYLSNRGVVSILVHSALFIAGGFITTLIHRGRNQNE